MPATVTKNDVAPLQLIAKVRSVTGITPEALARKLGVKVAQLEGWQRGTSKVPPKALRALSEIIRLSRQPARKGSARGAQLTNGVVCADSVEYLDKLPGESVDMILSDIPYGIGHDAWDVLHDNKNSAYLGQSAAQRRAGGVFKTRRKPINGWSSADRSIPKEYQAWCATWASNWLRVLKPGGSAVVFAGRRLAPRLVVALEDAGFNHRDMLGWRRPGAVLRAQRLSVVFQRRGDLAQARRFDGWRVGNLKPSFEPIVWCFKPYRGTIADNMLERELGAINLDAYQAETGCSENMLEVGFDPKEQGHHPAQKPTRLLRALIALCTCKKQLVLDPFAGSGSSALAAAELGRHYLAIEQDSALCKVARRRLEAIEPPRSAT
jgi:site-specific DNA-methyltransferase (adenine-specific)